MWKAIVIAERDLRRFWRYRFWLAGQIVMNIADIVIFGLVFSSMITIPGYVKFITPGILSLAMFISSFSIGREVGVELRREVTDYLVSLPVSRFELVFGRFLGGALRGIIYQSGFIILALIIVGAPTISGWAIIVYTSITLSFAMSALSIALSTVTKDFNLQATIRSVTYYILFFFSNIFYPAQAIAMRLGPLGGIVSYMPLSVATSLYRWGFRYSVDVDIEGNVVLLAAWTLVLVSVSWLLYQRNITRKG
ncbi:ABC transporter permease [Thermogladius sp. 4427co]|uniref:ABC transporter permease n=1 Tax=Thermogladius sp. 4427co TaxID=3450718 RepID=UPI003F7A355D